MSSVNYSLKHKGVKLIPAEKAWSKTKFCKRKLNSKYSINNTQKEQIKKSKQILGSPPDFRSLSTACAWILVIIIPQQKQKVNNGEMKNEYN